MSATAVITPARKGDLILVEMTRRDYTPGQGASECTEYEYGVVASATRDGLVKTWAGLSYGDGEPVSTDFRGRWVARQVPLDGQYWVVPKSRIDVDGVLAAAKGHHWPGHPGQPMPYGSYEEAREVALRFRQEVSVA